jgi:hypothetical protein
MKDQTRTDQVKLVIGTRLVLCTRVVKGRFTFVRRDKDLGDARHLGFDYSEEANAFFSASMKVHPNAFWKSSTAFIEPLIIK